MKSLIRQRVDAYIITSADRFVHQPARFEYSCRDPLAVRVKFTDDCGMAFNTWTFSRSLVAEGVRVPAGDGDVKFHPCGPLWTGAEFSAQGRTALLQFDSLSIGKFLRRTYDLVAPGREYELLRLDEQLKDLLAHEDDEPGALPGVLNGSPLKSRVKYRRRPLGLDHRPAIRAGATAGWVRCRGLTG